VSWAQLSVRTESRLFCRTASCLFAPVSGQSLMPLFCRRLHFTSCHLTAITVVACLWRQATPTTSIFSPIFPRDVPSRARQALPHRRPQHSDGALLSGFVLFTRCAMPAANITAYWFRICRCTRLAPLSHARYRPGSVNYWRHPCHGVRRLIDVFAVVTGDAVPRHAFCSKIQNRAFPRPISHISCLRQLVPALSLENLLLGCGGMVSSSVPSDSNPPLTSPKAT
jgi:hypothetical protein